MIFSPSDVELVEMIETVAEIAQDINKGLKPEEKEVKKFYIDTLVKRYMRIYWNENNSVKGRTLFTEGINWYMANNCNNQKTLSGIVKSLMRELILQPYDKYRGAYHSQ